MCLFRIPQPKAQPGPPPTTPRAAADVKALPTKQDVVAPDTRAGVEYGTTAKQSGEAAAKKTGTAALKIPLNTGSSGAGQGGMNV